jgi:hypothetical protein
MSDLVPDPPELVALGRMRIDLGETHLLPGVPSGTRIIVECAGGRFEGERLNATVKGNSNADWVSMAPDGTAGVDVRVLLETDDGALVHVTYTGRLHLAEQTVLATPQFETGDERYGWLNGIQAVAKGATDGATQVVYDVFEFR